MGGSTTFGIGTGPANTYPSHLKGLMKVYANSHPDKKYEIINAGICGNTTFGMLYQLDRTDIFHSSAPKGGFAHLRFPPKNVNYTLLDLKPDIVVLAPMFNDLYYGFASQGIMPSSTKFSDRAAYFYYFQQYLESTDIVKYNAIGYYMDQIYHIITDKIHAGIITKAEGPDDNKKTLMSDYKKRLTSVIEKLLNNGVKVVLVQFPYQPTNKGADSMEEIYRIDNKILKEMSSRYSLPFIDLMKDNQNQYEQPDYWYDFVHPSAYGYNDYAVKIFNRLFEPKPNKNAKNDYLN